MAQTKKIAPKFPYVLLYGFHHGFDEDGERHVFKGGDIVQLTQAEAKALTPKFKSQIEVLASAEIAARTAAAMKEAEMSIAAAHIEGGESEESGEPSEDDETETPPATNVKGPIATPPVMAGVSPAALEAAKKQAAAKKASAAIAPKV